jgi:hypothetical protein
MRPFFNFLRDPIAKSFDALKKFVFRIFRPARFPAAMLLLALVTLGSQAQAAGHVASLDGGLEPDLELERILESLTPQLPLDRGLRLEIETGLLGRNDAGLTLPLERDLA